MECGADSKESSTAEEALSVRCPPSAPALQCDLVFLALRVPLMVKTEILAGEMVQCLQRGLADKTHLIQERLDEMLDAVLSSGRNTARSAEQLALCDPAQQAFVLHWLRPKPHISH